MMPDDIRHKVSSILHKSVQSAASEETAETLAAESLAGDGSNRRFWRITGATMPSRIVIAPENNEENSLQEARSAWFIGRHLYSAGVPVPELFGFDAACGLLVCEDVGNTHLHGVAAATDYASGEQVEQLRGLYRQTLDSLVGMQSGARHGFDVQWCWDTPVYDRAIMLERESGYFLRAFWQGLLQQNVPAGLQEEFEHLAEVACSAPNDYFLHRDFQSRNVMICDGKVRIIDYQGGRLGPLGYDLASLLLDPYALLPVWFQEELYGYYQEKLGEVFAVDMDAFHATYPALALQRNLQILGAFSFLSQVRGKPFFKQFIRPSLASLLQQLQRQDRLQLPVLAQTAMQAQLLLNKEK